MAAMQSFALTSDVETLRGENVRFLEIPSTLANKDALIAWYARALGMPEYFGGNWDAFDECLRDLSWIEERRIVLYHRDLPLSESVADQKIYVDVLVGASRDWKPGEAHELIVAFDPACELKLRRINRSADID